MSAPYKTEQCGMEGHDMSGELSACCTKPFVGDSDTCSRCHAHATTVCECLHCGYVVDLFGVEVYPHPEARR